MKLFSAAQIKQWDAYTIAHEPVSSVNLMERAAAACCNWLLQKFKDKQNYFIFCGKGNNGGDGLALARLLHQHQHTLSVFILQNDKTGTPGYNTNLKKLQETSVNISFINSESDFPVIKKNTVIIDALFGIGLNKPLTSRPASLVMYINRCSSLVIAVDIPSGLYADETSINNTVIEANYTLSFQQPKLAFLLAENAMLCGEVQVLDIGFHPFFAKHEATVFNLIDYSLAKSIYRPRKKFTHKGTYGHAVIIAGSYGMMGAAVLSAGACLRSGTGKLTCFIPQCGYEILQTTVPEAMCKIQGQKNITEVSGVENFEAIGIGPGIGSNAANISLLQLVFKNAKAPLVIDADALNCIVENKELLHLLPKHAILTPHPKEFERLFGPSPNHFARLQLALEKAKQHNIYIILKGHYSFIAKPEGEGYFNTTGNAGMATAGSGDVLTGILTALLAQKYTPFEASVLGVYLHGLAGDIAAEKSSMEALLAGDITLCLGQAFKKFCQ
jgi:hydroxyethylthiazole kinase-like uncharacterized protein yjeF